VFAVQEDCLISEGSIFLQTSAAIHPTNQRRNLQRINLYHVDLLEFTHKNF